MNASQLRRRSVCALITLGLLLTSTVLPAQPTEEAIERKLQTLSPRVANKNYYMAPVERTASLRSGRCKWTYTIDSWMKFDETGQNARQTTFYSEPSDNCAYAAGYSRGAVVRDVEIRALELQVGKGLIKNPYGQLARDVAIEWVIGAYRKIVASPNTNYFVEMNLAIGDQDYLLVNIGDPNVVRITPQMVEDLKRPPRTADFVLRP